MPRQRKEQGPRYRNRRRGGPGERRRMAIIFALTLGWVGTHRFTLGQWQWGLLHIFLFILSMAAADSLNIDLSPWLTLSALIAYFHAYRWYKMSDDEFGEQFLEPVDTTPQAVQGRYLSGTEVTHPRVLSARSRATLLASAKTAYEAYDYQLAAERYEQALDLDLNDGESRVLSARCYSLLENSEAAYRHLARAVALRAENLSLVQSDSDFAWLRTQPDFSLRRTSGFAMPSTTGPPVVVPDVDRRNGSEHQTNAQRTPSSLGKEPPALPVGGGATLLDDLERLARLRDRGILNEVEFAREKERLLRD